MVVQLAQHRDKSDASGVRQPQIVVVAGMCQRKIEHGI
jgi:hypothetical protein